MSIEMQKRLGWNWDNYAPDWQRAVDAARGIYSGGVTNVDDAYFMGRGLRKDHLAGLALELELSDAVRFKSTLYHHKNQGQGQWYTPYSPSSATVPISIRTTEYAISRNGIVNDLTWAFDHHAVNAGLWFERNVHGLTRNFYAVTGPDDTNRFLTNPMKTGFKQDFVTETVQYSLQDSVVLLDERLKMNVGIKSPKVRIDATSLIGRKK
jgi:iron complex outermembrane receptor protein